MKTLIIYAHPETNGHGHFTLKSVEEWHKKNQIDYELIDLYKIKYDPVLHEDEHYTAGNVKITEQNKKFQEKIRGTERLIFIYPVWWGSMPAILKGFFDRVFTAGFAFNFSPAPILGKYIGGIPIKLLKGKKAAVFLTTGTIKFFCFLVMGDRFKDLIKRDILGFFGIKAKVFHTGKATLLNAEQQEKIRRNVKKGMNYLYS